MASEKAIEAACEAYARFEGPNCICVTAMRAALDAAAAVDDDAQREALAQFMIRNSFATGHGDTHADLLAELETQITERGDAGWNAAIKAAEQLLKDDYAYEAAELVKSLKRG